MARQSASFAAALVARPVSREALRGEQNASFSSTKAREAAEEAA
jgi:hypothetical protein